MESVLETAARVAVEHRRPVDQSPSPGPVFTRRPSTRQVRGFRLEWPNASRARAVAVLAHAAEYQDRGTFTFQRTGEPAATCKYAGPVQVTQRTASHYSISATLEVVAFADS